MIKNAIISKHSDNNSESNWLEQLEKNLVKDAVQSKKVDDSLFHQLNNIMNGTKSKYKSVQDAVEDMKARSGFTSHISKLSKNETETKKVAFEDATTQDIKPTNLPIVIKKCPQIKNTIENFIRDTKGNISIPAIIQKVKSIHQRDVSDDKDWDEDNLLRYVSKLNLLAKKDNPANYENHMNLGSMEPTGNDEADPSNTDAFHALQPASNN